VAPRILMYLDSHAHLDAAEFDADRDAVIARARQAGLAYILLIADLARPESVERVREMTDRHEGTYWAAGIDPHQSAQAHDEHFEALAAAAQDPKFLAVGEIGLDYFYDYPRDVQTRVFVRQLELARWLRRPIIIHCRDAWADLRAILRERLARGPSLEGSAEGAPKDGAALRSGILHCFTGAADDALDLIGLGFYVSFAGNLTYKRSEDLRQVARALPADRLLVETDSPYLAPVPHRGDRNEPAFARETTRRLAELQGRDEEAMGRQLVDNFERLFELDGRIPSFLRRG
jgi:TatD DNase family protein